MRLPKLFPAFILLLAAVRAPAQSVHWDPPGGQLGYNQVSELTLVFDNCGPDGDPAVPQVDGLNFGRPSQSSQTSIVNFKMTQTFSYIYPVRPTHRSAISIPVFEVKTDKGTMRVAAANFTVGDTPVGGAGNGPALDDVAAAKLTVPKDTFWAGEVFPVVYNLNVVRRYFHSLATNIDWQPAPFVAEDWTKPDPGEALVQGERRVISAQSTRAYARQPGTYTLKPASQMVNLIVGSTGFGIFSAPSVEQRQIDSNPVEVTILPLPPAPADFSKAVGEFTFTSKVVPITAAVGEPVTWTLELAGTGNWPDLTGLPQRDVSNDFQVVQPKSRRTMKDGSLFEGTLSEDVVLVPTKAGTYQLAPVRFTYFDTKTGTYRTVASDNVTVTVTAAAQPAQAPAGTGAPVQFSINTPPPAAAAPALPPATPPVTPENLPRDPLPGSGHGYVPLPQHTLVQVCLLSSVLCILSVWLLLATLRSRQNDPQRLRRAARAQLAAVLAEMRAAGAKLPAQSSSLKTWQQLAAALWEVPHAAPGAPLVHALVTARDQAAAAGWARLWSEADRALHSRDQALPADWTARADNALQAVRVPGWPPFSSFAPRNLLPFLGMTEEQKAEGLNRVIRVGVWLALLFSLSALQPSVFGAESAGEAYKRGDFAAAEAGWSKELAAAPTDWTARHNLGLALAQQDRWAEATAHWTGAFLLNARADATRWDLALGLQRSGLAPVELVELSRGEGRFGLVRLATPGEWQLTLILAALLLAAALILLLLQGYRRIGAWGKPVALTASLLAVVLAVAATLSLHAYGPLADPAAVFVWRPATLRSIPTDADTAQKSSPLSAGSLAVAEKTFLGWTKLQFPGGQSGWVRSEDLISLYR